MSRFTDKFLGILKLNEEYDEDYDDWGKGFDDWDIGSDPDTSQ